jgi:4-hydroxy-3-polyprenylbenzoate decarboxylase
MKTAQMESKRKIIVAVTGASGVIYAKLLLGQLRDFLPVLEEIAVIFSDNAFDIWKYEIGLPFQPESPFRLYSKNDFNAPFASGSSDFKSMIICPCSMGTLGRIAGGISDDLITRAADVMLKERRPLILVPRETPLNLIHIENMRTVTLAGGIICPAIPSFYSGPENIEDLAKTVVFRILNLAGFEIDYKSWGS